MHAVPTFKDSKVTLTDSHAILIYLCENYGNENSPLWPSDPMERIKILNKLFYSGTVLFRHDSDAIGHIIVYKAKKEKVKEYVIKLQEQFNILEKFLTSKKFIAGEHVWINSRGLLLK